MRYDIFTTEEYIPKLREILVSILPRKESRNIFYFWGEDTHLHNYGYLDIDVNEQDKTLLSLAIPCLSFCVPDGNYSLSYIRTVSYHLRTFDIVK